MSALRRLFGIGLLAGSLCVMGCGSEESAWDDPGGGEREAASDSNVIVRASYSASAQSIQITVAKNSAATSAIFIPQCNFFSVERLGSEAGPALKLGGQACLIGGDAERPMELTTTAITASKPGISAPGKYRVTVFYKRSVLGPCNLTKSYNACIAAPGSTTAEATVQDLEISASSTEVFKGEKITLSGYNFAGVGRPIWSLLVEEPGAVPTKPIFFSYEIRSDTTPPEIRPFDNVSTVFDVKLVSVDNGKVVLSLRALRQGSAKVKISARGENPKTNANWDYTTTSVPLDLNVIGQNGPH